MRILHVEDNAQDAELVQEMLREEWPDCAVTVVENRKDFVGSLAKPYDVILSDFTLGGFDGLEALRVARQLAPETPFVFVSGSIGEERAIDAVRSGASDYVIKDRMKRLTTAIRRALSEAKEAARRREAERRSRHLMHVIDQCREAITVTDLEDRFTFWNEGAERLLGWRAAEVLGRTTRELFGLEAEPVPREAVMSAGEWHGEVLRRVKSGEPRVLDVHVSLVRDEAGAPTGFLRIAVDITEKKKLEEQFLRVQRLETLGLLAAGIAHDLNNVLAPITLGAAIVRERSTDPVALRMLDTFEKSAERGSGLVRQILVFARGASGEQRVIDIGPVVRELVGVIEATFPKTIRLEHEIAPELWPVLANATQIHQVLLNLCVNARDAMGEDEGVLRLTGSNLALQGAAAGERGLAIGDYVTLAVSDTGSGIPPEILERIWQPFFTTKQADKGTGLGLSTVRGILENHKGSITVETQVGRGTTFRIFLPAHGRSHP